VLLGICIAYTSGFLAYLAWSHAVIARLAPGKPTRVARAQYRRRPSLFANAFSFGTSEG